MIQVSWKLSVEARPNVSVQTELGSYVYQTPTGGWRVVGSRVSLDSVVHSYAEGCSPEEIRWRFPTLSLEQVYGAITFYLRNQSAVDEYLRQQESRFEQLRVQAAERNRELRERILQRSRNRKAVQFESRDENT
jgi:uncharacterized protein (DUF433 family)